MLIFGFGPRKPKDHGPVAPLACLHCGNLNYYHFVSQKSAVSLFFVPVVPTGSKDMVMCPTCRFVLELTRPQAARAADMVRLTSQYQRGAVTGVEYGLQVDAFWHDLVGQPGPSPTPPPPPLASAAPAPAGAPPPVQRARDGGPPPPRPEPPTGPPPDPEKRRADPDPGWYPDPFGDAGDRYWDGSRWTRGTRPPT